MRPTYRTSFALESGRRNHTMSFLETPKTYEFWHFYGLAKVSSEPFVPVAFWYAAIQCAGETEFAARKIMPLDITIAFTLLFLFDSLAPGPAVAAVIAKGATTGARRTTPFILGLVVGELFFFALALTGLAALAANIGPLFVLIKWVGIAYLMYLAFKLWNAPPVRVSTTAPDGEGLRLLSAGTLLPLGNPMTIGFYVALLPVVLDVTTVSLLGALEMAVIIVSIWGAVLFGYALAADRASQLISTPKAQTWLNRTAAGAMVGAAGMIATRQ